jgi:hypothetical protein
MSQTHRHRADAQRNHPPRRRAKSLRRPTAVISVALTAVLSMLAWLTLSPNASADDEPVASFDYVMPERTKAYKPFSSVTDVRVPSPQFIDPQTWKVKLDACNSTPGARFFWQITLPDRVDAFETGQVCSFDYDFPAQGTYPVTLTATDLFDRTATTSGSVTVKDYLIVSIGDSVAAGEGNAEEGIGPQTPDPYWGDRRCHRSGYSGPAQAALRLERADPHTSITFVSVACSGASIDSGLILEYMGSELHGETTPLDAQILAVSKLLCPGGCGSKHDLRNIDAMVLNVGANDLHFSDIVYDCAYPEPSTPCHAEDGITDRLNAERAALPGKFDWLANQLDDWLLFSKLYVMEYFNPTYRDDGDFCDEIRLKRAGPGGIDGVISDAEVLWAHLEVILPLNTIVREAADRHADKGWTFVGGVADRFRGHGYCANDSWIVQYEVSMARQGNRTGTMHPNQKGQNTYAEVLLERLRPDLGF